MVNIKLIAFGGSIAAAFLFGRFSAPEKIKIEKQTITVQSESKLSDESKEKEKIETDVKRPDGTVITRIRYINKTEDLKTSTQTSETVTTEKKEISSQGGVSASLLVGTPLDFNLRIVYGVRISEKIIGPFFITGDGLIDGGKPVGKLFAEIRF